MQTTIRPHEHFHLSVERLGREGAPVVVIDNFIANAAELVDDAVKQAPFHPVGSFYPGLRSPVPMPYPLAVYQLLRLVIGDVFALGGQDVVDSRCNFCLVTKPAAEVEVRQRIPHCDSPDLNVIVVLHYLFDNPYGGTSFYRHRQTGFEMVTAERKPAYEQKVAEELSRHQPQDYINGDTDFYERLASFPARFNRALIYRSASLHSADLGGALSYGDHPAQGRLTANMSFLFGPQAVISLRRR
jgi:hypothetical protein